MIVRTLPLLAALIAALPAPAGAQLRATLLATGFDRPNTIVVDPMVPGTVYIVDQIGLVRAFLNGVERPTPFLDLRGVVSGGFDERGLLGMAFPPDGATSGRVFVHFTNRTGAGNSVVRRYTRSASDPMVADSIVWAKLRALSLVFSARDISKIIGQGAARATLRQDQIGTLDAGKQADLVLIDGNPLTDINDLQKVVLTVKGGRIVSDTRGKR